MMDIAASSAATVRGLSDPSAHCRDYAGRLAAMMAATDWAPVATLAQELADCTVSRRQVFICGNGGSLGNAIHLANDFLYGVAKHPGRGLRVTALGANPAVLTCLANDEGYERVFELQLAELANPGDILLVLSGSGNSPNVVRALRKAREMGVRSYAILGFGGGRSAELADVVIHSPVDDMQISEDMQLVVGHMLMQWLWNNREALAAQHLGS